VVTQSLKKGLVAGGSRNALQERLELLSRDMTQLFEKVLLDVDQVHRKPFAYYVQFFLMSAQCPSLLDSQRHHCDYDAVNYSDETVHTRNERFRQCTESQMLSLSAGLIGISSEYGDEQVQY
jgi:hypothetical protein